MTDTMDAEVHHVTIWLCDLCLSGKGGECHVPGCALWMNRAPDMSIEDKVESVSARFYMSVDCECGEEILMGPCLTTIEHNGIPVIPYDFAAQETFSCECGQTYLTGDFDVMNEDEL